MAPRSRARRHLRRSAPNRATAQHDPTIHVRPMLRARHPDVGQRRGARVHDGPHRAPLGAVPAEQRLALEGHRRDGRLRAHGRDRDGHGRVVCAGGTYLGGGDGDGDGGGVREQSRSRPTSGTSMRPRNPTPPSVHSRPTSLAVSRSCSLSTSRPSPPSSSRLCSLPTS